MTVVEPMLLELSERLGLDHFGDVQQLTEEHTAADATLKFTLGGPPAQFILIISNPSAPLMVRRNVDKMRMARSLLSDQPREAIELPLIEGEHEDRSYALWRMQKPLSANRVLRRIQKMMICPSVLRWINDIARDSFHFGNSAQLVSYVERLLSVSGLPDHIKASAIVSRSGFLTGEIAPIMVLEHGDLWIGNVLRAASPTGFIVIDWAGATGDGLPFFDLVRFACSIGSSSNQLRRLLRRYGDLIQCSSATAMPYILAGLGRLHLELEHFPESGFLALCQQKVNALRSAL